MKLAITKGSFQDSPTGSSLVTFIPGCNVKCRYCQNSDLAAQAKMPIADVLKEIRALRSINVNTGEAFHTYEWVIISGGEPLLQVEVVEQLLSEVRRVSNGDEVPIKTGIYTNGTKHEELRELVGKGLLDYVHVDYKLKPEDLSQYGFSEKDREAFLKTIQFVVKQYVAKKLDYLKLSTVLTKQEHTHDYIVDMVREASTLFAVQPTYVLREETTREKFVWEFVDFFNDNGNAKILDPLYTMETTRWDDDQKKALSRSLKIINSFKSSMPEKLKKELVFHPDHYNKGRKGYECINIMKEVYGKSAYYDWLLLNCMKYLYRLGSKDDTIQELKKVQFYINELVKLEEEKE